MKLVVFDVDGTLVDSQGDIVASMTAAFGAVGQPVPSRAKLLGGVGLSLPLIMARHLPDESPEVHAKMVTAYKDTYADLRRKAGAAASSPSYPGVTETLASLSRVDDVLLGVATGKSRRGLDALIEAHGWEGVFVTLQTADDHPSKPHPSMLTTAMAAVGVVDVGTVMIGDTTFDMDMAANAGVPFIGVSWGYHAATQLEPSLAVLQTFEELPGVLSRYWGVTA